MDMVQKVIDLAAADSLDNADGQSSVVVICGTGYIMPDARLQLGIREPRWVNAFIALYPSNSHHLHSDSALSH